jgi:tetratricopeptide (TPR) repeat protein
MDPHAVSVAVPKAKKPESERVMAPTEVHLMLARIRPWDSRESILAAGAELAEARRLAGDHPSAELHYWSGLYALRWRHFDEAERELRLAVAVEPARARHWLGLAEALAHDERPDAPAELDDVVARLAPLATSAYALDFLARYYSGRGQIDAGLPYARRAVATERGCWECIETLSVLQNLAHASTAKTPPDDRHFTKPTID